MIAQRWLQQNQHRWLRWTRTIGSLAISSLAAQLISAIAGFILIRSLEKPDFAWFTIATGITSTLNILADAGIGGATTAIGGTVWQNKQALSNLVETALRLRVRMTVIAAVVTAPISLYLLTKNNCPWSQAISLTIIVLLPLGQISTTMIYTVVNRLHSRTKHLQIADLVPASTRMIVVCTLAATDLLSVTTALAAGLATQLLHFGIVRSQVSALVDAKRDDQLQARFTSEIWTKVRQLYPNSIFYCLQGQLSTWLITIFASTNEVADFGALCRIAVIFAVFNGPMAHWISPAFARAKTRRRCAFIFLGSYGLVGALSAPLILCAAIRPEWLLWVLGPGYQTLTQEVFLMSALTIIQAAVNIGWGLNYAKGWVKTVSANIPLTIGVQATALIYIPVDTLSGVILLSLCVSCVQWLHATSVTVVGILRHSHQGSPATR